jgi:hypothetical protein
VNAKDLPGKVVLLAMGGFWLWAAYVMDAAWFVRHVEIPTFYLTASPLWPPVTRACAAGLGLLFCVLGALLGASLGQTLRILLALVLALVVSDCFLHLGGHGTAFWRAKKLELRMGRPDAEFGNVLLPSRTTVLAAPGSEKVSYSIDAWGNRAQSDRGAPDPSKPALVVAGESIAAGHGLPFEQTFASLLASKLELQLVDVGVGGYGTDQALWRLEETLPKLAKPQVVVMVFLPIQLWRNVQDYRPRLVLESGALTRRPPERGLLAWFRLRDVLVNELPLLTEERLQSSLEVTAAVLRETAARVRARGATPLFLIPLVGPRRSFEDHPEAQVLRPLFVEQKLPFLLIDLDESELIPYDGHPNAAASRRIAGELEARLISETAPSRAPAASAATPPAPPPSR